MPAMETRERKFCAYGHPLSGDNVRINTSGVKRWRRCKICEHLQGREYRERTADRVRTIYVVVAEIDSVYSGRLPVIVSEHRKEADGTEAAQEAAKKWGEVRLERWQESRTKSIEEVVGTFADDGSE